MRDAIDRVATDRVILAAGWLLFLVYAFPGYMSWDSVFQLAQARHLEPINEWHPPLMTFMWRITDHVFAGPLPMLVIQSVAFLLGTWALLRLAMSTRAAAIVAVVMLLLPQNIIIMAVIWKDAQMDGYLVVAIAALFSTRRGWRTTGYLCLFLATAVRYNAAAATLPIVFFQFGFGGTLTRWRRRALAIVAWICITAAAFGANAALVEKRIHPWETSVALVDIAATIRWGPTLTDAEIHDLTPGVPWAKAYPDHLQEHVRAHYRPEFHFLHYTREPHFLFDYPETDADFDAIAAAWKRLAIEYPVALLRHRLAVFRAQLRVVPGAYTHIEFTNPVYDELIKHRATHSALQSLWIRGIKWFVRTFEHGVSLYFALALLLLPFARREPLALVLLTSGLVNELGLSAVAPGVDYRYSQWMVAATLLAAVVLFATRRRRCAPST